MDDAAMTLTAHHRHQTAGQVMPAEEIRLELLLERRNGQVLDGAGLSVGAVVEQGIELAARAFQNRCNQRLNGCGFAIVEVESLDAVSLQRGDILRLAPSRTPASLQSSTHARSGRLFPRMRR